MRLWSGLLVALLLTAPASAQVAAWSDPEGDQTITYSGTQQGSYGAEVPNEAGWYPQFDIVRAGMFEETPDDIVFELMVTSEEPSGSEPDDSYLVSYKLHFTYHEEPFRLNVYWYPSWADMPFTYLERLEGDYWQYVTWVETGPHPDGEGWTMTLPKWDLRDLQLIPAREGDAISDIHAVAERSEFDWSSPVPRPAGFQIFSGGCVDEDSDSPDLGGPGCGFNPRDEAGTAASPLGSYVLTESPEGLGHILLETERPFRASNGLATTYVYQMRLFNLDDEPDTVSLAAANIPANWDIYLPPRVDLEAGQIKDIRMAVSVPFGHKHGESASVDILAKSQRDPQSTSETTLIVFWPEIAQPSGHHPRLYFHADGYRRWMNTAQEDPEADGSGVVGASRWACTLCVQNGDDGPKTVISEDEYYWYLYLRPGLFTGLDFDTTGTVEGNLDIAVDETIDSTVTTQLMLYREDQDPLVIAEQIQQVAFTAGEARSVAVSMPVVDTADRIPFETNSALYFNIDVYHIVDDPSEADPETVQAFLVGNPLSGMDYPAELYSGNSYLDLPLLDYHDDVDPGLLDALTRLQLEAPEEVVRPVNPGKTAAYFFEVVNKGDLDDTVEWSIEGPKADWASVVPVQSKVGSQSKATVAIRVDVPADAISDEVADLLLVGQSTKDPDAQVFGNFQAYVETDADIPDESDRFAELQGTAEKDEAKGAPFPTVVAAMAALGVAVFARRRQD